MIVDDCKKTRILLRKHCWATSNGYGIASTKKWHNLFFNYEDGLIPDHINNKRFDNRMENIRIVTQGENNKNKTKYKNNTSGKQGLSRWTEKRSTNHYWKVQIMDNNSKLIAKLFSIKKLGDSEAKRQAIEYRKQLEILYGYIGD